MTELRIEAYEIPAAALGPENPLPVFRPVEEDWDITVAENVPEEDRRRLGKGLVQRILPHRMLDDYTRERHPRAFRAVVLENEHLRAMFTPELGGRLASLIHKASGRDLLECNPVFQPTNVALRNAWISGGVEWNTSILGHYHYTVSPVFAARVKGTQGDPVLRIYEWDRVKCFPWQIDFHLPPGSRFLYARPRLINPHDSEIDMYWWSNIAVPQHPEWRTLVPAKDALSHPPGSGVLTVLPLPEPAGYDVTYPTNAKAAGEAFFRIPKEHRKWVAQVDQEGKGLVHASTDRLRGRKMFFWGTSQGGTRWQEQLSVDGRAYIELQGGLARTQVETVPMPAGAEWAWTEAYGLMEADPAKAHGPDWEAAYNAVDTVLDATLPREMLDALHEEFEAVASRAPEAVLATGSGWGALERKRTAAASTPCGIPEEAIFESATLGADQAQWLALLEDGALPERSVEDGPGSYLVQKEWRVLLEKALAKGRGDHWASWLHLGVMRMEALDPAGAREAWTRSLELRANGWALRNLAKLEEREGRKEPACDFMRQAWKVGPQNRSIAQELAQSLIAIEHYTEAKAFIEGLPEGIRKHERILLASAKCALETGDFEHVEDIFNVEFAQNRECETSLSDLWFAYHANRIAQAEGIEVDDALRARVQKEFPPPKNIDFRMTVQ